MCIEKKRKEKRRKKKTKEKERRWNDKKDMKWMNQVKDK
jgi:hypothetical protein